MKVIFVLYLYYTMDFGVVNTFFKNFLCFLFWYNRFVSWVVVRPAVKSIFLWAAALRKRKGR